MVFFFFFVVTGKATIGSNATGTTTTTTPPPTAPTPPVAPSASIPKAKPTLSERELIKIEFYKTYDPMVGIRIAATLSGFFGLMVIMVIYKNRYFENHFLFVFQKRVFCLFPNSKIPLIQILIFIFCFRSKKNRQLNDPRLTAAAEAAVAEAEAEEALAAALEARLNHGRRSLCPDVRINLLIFRLFYLN